MLSRNNDYYFYLGGLISFASFLIFSTLFLLFILQQTRVKHVQIKASDYISVNLNTIKTAPPKKVTKTEQHKSEEPKPEALETIETPKQVNTDLNSLFGEVKTTKLVKRNKTQQSQVDDTFLKKIKKRIQTKDTKTVKSTEASSLVKNLKLSKQNIKVVGDSSGVVDEYLAKIHAEIYSKFFPPVESVGRSAKVRLEIDANGVLVSFRVISYSGDGGFDAAVDRCMDSLHQFATHPDHKKISLDIILTAKE